MSYRCQLYFSVIAYQSIVPVSPVDISSATAPLPTLHQLFGTDSQKTSVSLHILPTELLISPILRSHSPLLHSIHDGKQNSLRYPIPVLLLHHHTSANITDCNRSTTLSPRLDLPGFFTGPPKKKFLFFCCLFFF